MNKLGGCGVGACTLVREQGSPEPRATRASAAQAPPGREAATPVHRAGGNRARDLLPPWHRVKAALQVDPLAYVHSLGRLAGNAR
jgi:hypothetical protein